jgi:hypothetical protein
MKKSLPPIEDRSQETCVYNTRSFRVDLKNRLKAAGLIHAKTLEEMVNWAIEVGVGRIERGEY